MAIQPCGLYKTTEPLSVGVEAGLLIYFHNHSKSGGAVFHLPVSNANNRWSFGPPQPIAASEARGLERLLPEGLYRLREHFHPDGDRLVAANSLVQLGYNREAGPILFFPTLIDGENRIEFPSRGMGIPPKVYDLLERLDVRGPFQPKTVH